MEQSELDTWAMLFVKFAGIDILSEKDRMMNTAKGFIPPFLLVIFAIIAVLSALAGAGWATAIAGSFTSLLIAVAVLFGLGLIVKQYFPNGKDRR